MSRILAIDYGRKRTGIAVSDPLQMIANGLTTVPTHQLLSFILDYVSKEPVERILVGLPKQMNNEMSENMQRIEPFVRSLKKKLPDMPIEYVDERFTSVLAHRTMLEAGLKRKTVRIRLWSMRLVRRLFCSPIWKAGECVAEAFADRRGGRAASVNVEMKH